jgi:NAD(P)-dependent dehydrogenase (short-subunit alcohol dehydrogenase family)
MDAVLSVVANGISVGFNAATSSTDSALFPEAAIDFSAMTGGGFDVPTGGTPVKLDFNSAIIMKDMVLDRMTEPRDIAPLVVFLASGLADHSTGTSIDVNAASYVR